MVGALTSADPLISDARRALLKLRLRSVPYLAFFLVVLYSVVGSVRIVLFVVLGVVLLIPILDRLERRFKVIRRASEGLWSKSYRFVSVEADGERVAHMTVILAVRNSGVVLSEQSISRFGRASYNVVAEIPWSDIASVFYVPGRNGWSRVVFRGPNVAVAPAASAGPGLSAALADLGASLS